MLFVIPNTTNSPPFLHIISIQLSPCKSQIFVLEKNKIGRANVISLLNTLSNSSIVGHPSKCTFLTINHIPRRYRALTAVFRKFHVLILDVSPRAPRRCLLMKADRLMVVINLKGACLIRAGTHWWKTSAFLIDFECLSWKWSVFEVSIFEVVTGASSWWFSWG